MQTNRFRLLWVLLAVALLALSACVAPAAPAADAPAAAPAEESAEEAAPAAAAPEGATTIEFWGGWTGPDAETMQAIVDRFNSEQEAVHVNLTMQQWSPLFDAFIVEASAGTSPDILAMHPQELAQFVELGLILPLDEIVANSEVIQRENYLDRAWELNMYNGQLYGIPLDLHMHGILYNADLFEAAGVEAPPANMEEFMAAATALTVDANGNHPGDEGFDPANVTQYAINAFTNHHAFFQWWSLYRQMGGELISEDGMSCVMDQEMATEAWQFLQDLVYVHHVAPQGQTDYPRDFLDGRTAMLIDGPWRIPQLEQVQAESGFNWGTAPYPTLYGDELAVWGSGHNFTLPSKADPAKQAAAVTFLEWMAANAADWAVSGQLPAYKSINESEEFRNMPGRQAYIASMPYEHILPSIAKYNQIFASNAPTPMMVMAQNIMLEQADPAAEVQTACDAITGILAVP